MLRDGRGPGWAVGRMWEKPGNNLDVMSGKHVWNNVMRMVEGGPGWNRDIWIVKEGQAGKGTYG